jgi:hypothetical protein
VGFAYTINKYDLRGAKMWFIMKAKQIVTEDGHFSEFELLEGMTL